MGCANSKAEESPVVSLCRDRRDLIAAAAGHRYSLADAHAAYFAALGRVGHALGRFVADELTAAPPSPVLTLPPSKSKSDGSDVINGSFTSSLSISSSSECSHLHLHPEDEEEEENVDPGSDSGSHLHFHSGSESERSFHGPTFTNPNLYYMKSSASVPSTIYVDPVADRYDYPNFGQDYLHYYYYNAPPPPMDNPVPAMPPPPPPPPVSEVSTWDFFNPFDSYEPMYPECSKGSFRSGSGSMSSPDSSVIREKEGIPDLEEETEVELEKEEAENVKKSSEVENGDPKVAGPAPIQEVVAKNAPGEGKSESGGPTHVREKGVSFREEMGSVGTKENGSNSSLSTEESRSGCGPVLHVHAARDVMEAVEDIKEKFKLVAGCGEEVSTLLEVGKLGYRSRNGLLRVIISRILDFMAQAVLTSSPTSSNQPQHSDAKLSKSSGVSSADSGYVSVKSDNLSSTLDKLYVWEKKLYKEIKDEEKLRVIYEKECRRLKALDVGGAESHKIDSTRAAIRKLLTKLSMTIRTIEVISSRIHKIRDEELRPQLIQLIQGLITMWKSMLDCHQNQFRAILESKSQYLTARTRIDGNSVAKATMELESELLNWCSCFRNWIRSQKAYIESLNGWLIKWLLQEQEETPDGVAPFSPGRIGAPAIFVIVNDWQHAVERISEVGVMTALHSFASTVHKLWESQGEEQRQKLKAEYLSRDLSRRLRSLQNDAYLDKRSVPVPISSDATDRDERATALDTMRRRLDEERAKHHEIAKLVQDVASSSLQQGLTPVFEALSSYTFETLQAYQELRIRNDADGTYCPQSCR